MRLHRCAPTCYGTTHRWCVESCTDWCVIFTSTPNISTVIKQLESMGFALKEPGLRGTAFHRMTRGALVADILVADHLPSGKARSAKVNGWPMMEIAGGAQAIERGMDLALIHEDGSTRIRIPDLLGALVLKSAAYCADRRDRRRHLDDIALLASLVTDHKGCIERLHGSDGRRLRERFPTPTAAPGRA